MLVSNCALYFVRLKRAKLAIFFYLRPKLSVLKFVLFPLCAGNLYSREVQVDGEQVTIQVQDTPGVEVRFYSLLFFSFSLLRRFIFPGLTR